MTFDTVKKSGARYAAAALIAAGLIAGAVAPQAAFAADAVDGTASTAVYLQADDSKIVASAPTEIHAQVNADGSFVTPDASATQLENGSIFTIHVDKVSATAQGGFSLVADAASATADDAVDFQFQPGDGAAIEIADYLGGKDVAGSDWDMTKAGTAGATIDLTTEGHINNVTKDLGSEHQFATVAWTFGAGANA